MARCDRRRVRPEGPEPPERHEFTEPRWIRRGGEEKPFGVRRMSWKSVEQSSNNNNNKHSCYSMKSSGSYGVQFISSGKVSTNHTAPFFFQQKTSNPPSTPLRTTPHIKKGEYVQVWILLIATVNMNNVR